MERVNRILMIAPTGGGKSTLINRLWSMPLFKNRKAIALDGDKIGYRNARNEWIIPGATIMLYSHESQVPFIATAMCANLKEVALAWDGDYLWLDNYDAETLYELSHKRTLEGKNTYSHADSTAAQKNIDYYTRIKSEIFEKKTTQRQIVIDMMQYLNEEEQLTQLIYDLLTNDFIKDSVWSAV